MADTPDTARAVASYLNNEITPQQLGANARFSMANAVGGNPGYEAELREVAKRTGVPVDTVRAYPVEMKKQATLGAYDFDGMAVQFPNATKFLADQDNATIGHADVETLKSIEQGFGSLLKWAMGNGPNQGFIGSAKAAPYVAASNLAGIKRFGVDVLGAAERGPDGFFGKMSQQYGAQARAFDASAKAVNPPAEGLVAGGLSSGGDSLMMNLKYLPLALTGPIGAAAALIGMSAETFGNSYNKGSEKGLALLPRTLYATADGVIEWATEKGPLGALLHNIKAGTPLFQSILSNAWRENKGEQVATLLQGLNEWAMLKPEQSLADHIKEVPAAAAQTLIAVLVGSGGNVTLGHAMQGVADKVQGRNRQLEYLSRQAEENAQVMEGLQKTMQASEILKHSPETLTAYAQSLVEQGAPNVYIDSSKLVEAGIDLQALAQLIPSIASQLDQAQTGGDLVIPTAELLTGTIGSEFSQSLIDNARLDVNGMSRLEAKVYMQSQGDTINAEIERVMLEKDNDAEFKAGRDGLQAQILQQLNDVKRFTPKVNEHYAKLAASFYAVMAARTGMTVTQFADTYKLGFSGQAGQGTYDQAMASQPPEGWEHATDGKSVISMWRGESDAKAVFWTDLNGSLKSDSPDLAGYSHSVGRSTLDHIRKRHSDKAAEASRNQVGIEDADIAAIPDIVTQYDAIRTDLRSEQGAQRIAYAKSVDGGVLIYIEDVSRKRSDMRGVTMWKYRGATDAATVLDTALKAEAQKTKGQENPSPLNDALRSLSDYESDAQTPSLDGIIVAAQKKDNAFNQEARGQIAFADDITRQASIMALFKGADLSSFIHEGGHFFLEVQSDLAARIAARMAQGEAVSAGEQSIVSDMNRTLDWMGIKGTPDQSALLEWITMPLEQKRQYHEQWARGFEAYAFEGKSPSLELTKMFQTFRAWLVNVYRAMLKSVNASKTDIAGTMKVELSDEVRAVMDRMLATSDQIAEAEAARSMGPLFKTAEEAGMTMDEFKAYHDQGMQSTMDAVDELQAKGLKDMQWLQNARSRKLKELQKQHDALRREAMMAVRAEVMSEDVYRAWTFLTAKGGDRVLGEKPVGRSATLDPATDNLFEAIAKLGGINRESAKAAWGINEKEKIESGIFGQPVLRKEGGKSIDAMAESLAEEGYILPGRNDQTDMEQLEALFDDQRRGTDRYSVHHDMQAAYGDAPVVAPELPMLGAGKLRTEALRESYGTADDAVWRKLSALRMTSDETGLHPDIVAEMFGFESGDELVQKLATAENPKDLITRLTDERMLQEHGDLATPAGIERAADQAIHNDARARFVATELKALQKAMNVREAVPGQKNTVDVLVKAAKEYAASVIARIKVRDIRPGQYAAAEVRSAKAAAKAGSDLEQAGLHKRNQLINLYATKAAYAAQDEIKAMTAYFKTFDKRSKTIDAGYLDQIEQMLERFDFRQASNKEIDRRKSFAAWYAEQEEAGNPPDVPDSLMQDAARKSFRDATVEELRGLRDTIKQIEHQGRLKNKLLLSRDKREFDAIADDMAGSIVAHGGPARAVNLEGPAPVTDWFVGLRASHRKLASLFREMDGNQDAGPMYQTIGRAMNERGTMEDVMVEQATEALREIYAPMLALRGGLTGWRSKLFIPEINASLTRGGRLSVALNWGNEANRQRILDGDQWSEAQVRAILKTLSVQELQFVNQVWEYLDTFWPAVEEKQKRLTGVAPEKVEAQPFDVVAADGSAVHMRGGYYPLKYDTDRSDRADTQEAAQAAKEMMQGVMTRATTRRGHTKERLKEVKRAVRKDLNVITQHVTQVTHDLAWHEWLIDTNKLLADSRVVDAIRDHYGPKVLKTMRDGVLGIATADVVPQTDIDKAMLMLRGNVTRATMGASLTTAFLQPFGLTQSMVRIGPKHVLRGAARWAGDAARMESSLGWVSEKSDFMRLRSKTFNRELREIRGSVAGKSKAMQVVDGGLFFFMQKIQLVADVPTWIGQYEKSLAGGLDEAAAVAMADRAVLESQGGGNTKDLAEVQRKHPMLTQFYSYFSVTLNLTAEQTAATDFKNPRAVAGWLGDMALLLIIPAILPALLLHAIKGGGDDDEADWAARLAKWQLGYLMSMVVGVRELSGAVSGFDYAGPPVGRIVGDIGKAGTQTVQGEVDEPAVMAYIKLMGTAFGIPVVQALRSYKGWKAWDEGEEGAGPQSVLFGPPSKD